MSSRSKPSILYVDAKPGVRDAFVKAFGGDYDVTACASADEAIRLLGGRGAAYGLLVADHAPPLLDGIALCSTIAGSHPGVGRMVVIDDLDQSRAAKHLNGNQVQDFVRKPWTKRKLKPLLKIIFSAYWNDAASAPQEPGDTPDRKGPDFDFHSLIGSSAGLSAVVAIIKKAAPTDYEVLVTGETGTGKELIARAIHANSGRRDKPFVAVHCAALASTLIESELFGHEKGAFTGADRARIGRFEAAEGGTVFLDELAEIPVETQVKLLRVLQEHVIFRVGGNKPIPVDVRVVSATNRDLMALVREGKFREDFYFRINVLPIRLPALRERKGDIPLLASYFLRQYCLRAGVKLTLAESAMRRLQEYDWPGNIRELQHAIERGALFAKGKCIEHTDLIFEPAAPQAPGPGSRPGKEAARQAPASGGTLRERIRESEAHKLSEALTRAQGNVAEAARRLGIPRTTLFSRLRKHGLV